MKKNSIEYKGKILRRGYLLGLLLMIGLVCAVVGTRKMPEVEQDREFVSIEKEWKTGKEQTRSVDMQNLSRYYRKGSDTVSVYWKLPEMQYDKSIVYRSKDVYTTVKVDGRTLYKTQPPQSRFYNRSPGNNWNAVLVPSKYSGKWVELQVQYVYDHNTVSLDHVYWGNRADIYFSYVKDKLVAMVISLIMVLVGLVCMLIDFSTFTRDARHSMFFLGLYALLMGLWSLLETNAVQLFWNDGRMIQLLDNILMIIDGLPFMFYLDAQYDLLKKPVLRIFFLADVVYIIICPVLQLLGVTDLHPLIKEAWIASGVTFLILMWVLAKQILLHRKKKKRNKAVWIQMFGLVILWTLVLTNLTRFVYADGMDRAQSIRMGMLIFVIMFAISGQLQTYELIKQGSQYNFVKTLAYQDGLTNLANRTSFLERIADYQNMPDGRLGVVFLDVNNLKYVNDTMGHEEGDRLIRTAAQIITETFGCHGIAYRIGGDEFCVFMEGEDPKALYEDAREKFCEQILAVNASGEFLYPIQIANGYAQCELVKGHSMQETIDLADARMYENKRRLKENSNKGR